MIFFPLFCILFILNANSIFIFCNNSQKLQTKLFNKPFLWAVFYGLSIFDGFILTIAYEYLFNPQAQTEGLMITMEQKNGYFYTTFLCFHIVCSVFGFVYTFLWKKIKVQKYKNAKTI